MEGAANKKPGPPTSTTKLPEAVQAELDSLAEAMRDRSNPSRSAADEVVIDLRHESTEASGAALAPTVPDLPGHGDDWYDMWRPGSRSRSRSKRFRTSVPMGAVALVVLAIVLVVVAAIALL
jgi:hypothetical protein